MTTLEAIKSTFTDLHQESIHSDRPMSFKDVGSNALAVFVVDQDRPLFLVSVTSDRMAMYCPVADQLTGEGLLNGIACCVHEKLDNVDGLPERIAFTTNLKAFMSTVEGDLLC
jgi:hypothetical protein